MESYTFQWNAIDDILAPKPKENDTCIVCMDCARESDWHLQIARWYEEGAKLELVDKYDKEHNFTIKDTGFYIVQETSAYPKLFKVHGVKYWTVLPTPKIKPDDILTIE